MRALPLALIVSALAPTAYAQPLLHAGTYLCTSEQRAGVGATHLENAPPPSAFAEHARFQFRIAVTRNGADYRLVEAPYDGPGHSDYQWEDDNSTLHAAYLGDGSHFEAADGHGFIDFALVRAGWGGELQFFHAGYEYAGGEDETLSVHWGRCASER